MIRISIAMIAITNNKWIKYPALKAKNPIAQPIKSIRAKTYSKSFMAFGFDSLKERRFLWVNCANGLPQMGDSISLSLLSKTTNQQIELFA